MNAAVTTILDAIGNTPLVRLSKLETPGCAKIWGKAEFMNPAASIKDRPALWMINEAEKQGRLTPGATIVEATAGNTGLGLAMIAAVKGYKLKIVMPDKMSQEKINMIKAFGAEVVVTRSDVASDHPDYYHNVARSIAASTPGSLLADQFNNQANIRSHYESTGPEIWEQLGKRVDCFVAGAGTGGTVTGVGKFLKEKSDGKTRIVGVEPVGSLYSELAAGDKNGKGTAYKVEGIGNDKQLGCLDFSVIDAWVKVSDTDSFATARDLVRKEGLFVGGSAGSNVWAAIQESKKLSADSNVVTILCDSADRYISKIFNDDWMKENGF